MSSSSSETKSLWMVITILCVIIFIGSFIIFGWSDFLGSTVGNTLIFISDTITDWGIAVLKIFNGVIREITQFILPVKKNETTTPVGTLDQAKVMPVSTPAVQQQSQTPTPTPATTPTPTPAPVDQPSWCFIGEANQKRLCVGVNDPKNCASGQVFPSLENCWIAK